MRQEKQNTEDLAKNLVFQDAKIFADPAIFDWYEISVKKKTGTPNQLKYHQKNFQPDRTCRSREKGGKLVFHAKNRILRNMQNYEEL